KLTASLVASSASRASVSERVGAAAMASDFGTNSAGWENSTGSASLDEMITRVPMRTLSNSFSGAFPCAVRVKKAGLKKSRGGTACSCVQKPPRNRLGADERDRALYRG